MQITDLPSNSVSAMPSWTDVDGKFVHHLKPRAVGSVKLSYVFSNNTGTIYKFETEIPVAVSDHKRPPLSMFCKEPCAYELLFVPLNY